jgi:serine protease inhibitor
MLVLTSIVNFKNDWEKEFVESKMGRFCLSSTNHIQANMMHLTEYFPYYKDEKNKFAAIELPYNVLHLLIPKVYFTNQAVQ